MITYLLYHQYFEMYLTDEHYVAQFLYVHTRDNELDISAQHITFT